MTEPLLGVAKGESRETLESVKKRLIGRKRLHNG